ncbi:wdr5 [Symbiodinium sp. CCMP2592]|nr:wdr5 [Symbiodinium sp. CCMP2592]
MTLADIRKGNHKKAINDLLMAQDINLLASASSDGSILMWDTATMKPKKTFKGHKKVPNLQSDGLLRFLRYSYRACEHVKTFGPEAPGSGHLLPGIFHGTETQQTSRNFYQRFRN